MAYIQTFTIRQVDPPQADQSFRMVLEFTGNAGEPMVRRDYRAGRGTTANEVRTWAYSVIAELNDKRSAYTTVLPLVGQSFTAIAPAAPADPTALEVWRAKVNKAQHMKSLVDAGVTALSAELATLLTDINGTYPGGF